MPRRPYSMSEKKAREIYAQIGLCYECGTPIATCQHSKSRVPAQSEEDEIAGVLEWLDAGCPHEHAKAGNGVLICADCGESFVPRTAFEKMQLDLYGNGKSPLHYQKTTVYAGNEEVGFMD